MLIKHSFESFVCNPFHTHAKTPGWNEEVLSRVHDWQHRTVTILERGQTDFNTPYKNLTADEKVTIYCYQYMQKHAASTAYVCAYGSRQGMKEQLHEPDKLILLDFGSGPATLAVALAWLKEVDGRCVKPLLNYIGIERSKAMRAKARHVTEASIYFIPIQIFTFLSPSTTPTKSTLLSTRSHRQWGSALLH